jgi:acetylornithine deacetylase
VSGAFPTLDQGTVEAITGSVDETRLVDLAGKLVGTPSPTGDEEAMGRVVAETCEGIGLVTAWQEVEPGRPNVVGTLGGSGGGQSLMFNGHMDTSYSGREPHLRGRVGFQPVARIADGRIWGLGIANMKGAIACYIEAVSALRDAGVRLRGDVLVAAVAGEIEKSQWGEEFRGAEYRGYSAGSHYLVSHGGAVADVCILGEPTENRVVTGHYGAMWVRLSTAGPHVHTAFSRPRREESSILRMAGALPRVLEWIARFEEETEYGGFPGVVNIGAIRGGHPWRLSRTPERTDLFLDVRVPPTMRMQDARRRVDQLVAGIRADAPGSAVTSEIYVTSPGAEIDPAHPLISALDAAHGEVFGSPPARDTVRWSSDAAVLSRYGIETVNYGASSGLPHPDGENLAVEELVKTAKVYALAAAQVCEVGT